MKRVVSLMAVMLVIVMAGMVAAQTETPDVSICNTYDCTVTPFTPVPTAVTRDPVESTPRPIRATNEPAPAFYTVTPSPTMTPTASPTRRPACLIPSGVSDRWRWLFALICKVRLP